ncbi:dentin sialophosphoprotein-like [Phalaenopsis equestris]|uniref:dentin sialophosphoprotein-like n=1 Tax=Phalaenopsis equestris TaxID=78828 RepID=UPI0009E63E58|nr:dentin sialophosphoprotein-like [Phalaenopsis equestris]XP_020587667.1 dentin sialophosphoprotein-like [Phalaenopsis equestris]XP_020587668.1 dentin sialophosphoprotein-like [Phalaenopsis equestris]XP_020587670.1 dentin sialophosphoprotein-like [Phalaenopsis equestris]
MFHYSSSRNHRSKGSNVKKILQVTVLLAVACWLLYQVKHSREKKIEFAGNDERKLSDGGEEVSLGRKGDAGSENVIIIDTSSQGSDESTEIKQDEAKQDSSDSNTEEKSKKISHNPELDDSKESNSINGEKESSLEEHSDSHNGAETLHLPNERERENSSDQNENSNEGEETPSVSTGKENEQENGEARHQEAVSVDDKDIKSLSETTDDNKTVLVDGGAGSDDAHVSSTQDDAKSTNDQVTDAFNSDTSLHNDNEASKEGEVEPQLGNASEVENSDKNSSGEMKIDGDSDKEIEILSNFSDTSNDVSFGSQSDKISDPEGLIPKEISSEANNNAVAELQENNEDAKVETDSENNSHESIEEKGKSSEAIEQRGSEDQNKEITHADAGEASENKKGNSDDLTGSDPVIEIAATGNEVHTVKEEGNDAASDDKAMKSSEVNEIINSDDSTNEVPAVEAVQVEGGNNFEAESTINNNTENSNAEGEASEEKTVQ